MGSRSPLLLSFAASLAIAGVALPIVSTDGAPESDEPVFRADLYELSLNNPLLKIEYANHPEYFIKAEATSQLPADASQPAAGFEQLPWQGSAASVRDLLGILNTWLLSR